MLDYLAIGHIAQDLTPDGVRLGGSATYAALTARAFGLNTGIVTAAAPEAALAGLDGVQVQCLPSRHSTTFENIYGAEGRAQILHARAELLTVAAIPAKWQDAQIVHLAPIANEVHPNLVAFFPSAFVGVTPQGWMRKWDAAGRVTSAPWQSAEMVLAKAAAAAVSIEDAAGDWNLIERWAAVAKILAVTEGEKGATVFWQGERRQFPAPAVTVIDPTGAGDIFAAAFFIRLWQTGDAWEAARTAVAVASDSVARVGINGVPDQETIRQYTIPNKQR